MIERLTGCLAVVIAGIGLWMAMLHVWDVRPRRIVTTLHLLGGAVLLELAVLAAHSPSPLAVGMIAAALATGLALPMTARRLPESAGMILVGHGAVALAAAALVGVWAVAS